uniref:Uncharacterized protein n=1 Tax=Anguilla anguilla TaxID=7936 RepID=A0A0E9XK01_ANGAN
MPNQAYFQSFLLKPFGAPSRYENSNLFFSLY